MKHEKVIVFHLARVYRGHDLQGELRSGNKRSEWRDCSSYWLSRLMSSPPHAHSMTRAGFSDSPPEDYTHKLKSRKIWLIIGFPPHSLPRFEADVVGLIYHPATCQLETKFANVKEVTQKGPVTIRVWKDKAGITNIAGECSECHQFPCKHSGANSSELERGILP